MIISRKHIFSFILLIIFSLIIIPSVSPVLADTSLINSQVGVAEIGSAYGSDPNNTLDIRFIIARIIVLVLGFLGAIFLGLTIFAGFRYMTAAGNEDQTKKAVSQIKNSVIGLIIVLASWSLTLFIINRLDLSIKGYYIF